MRVDRAQAQDVIERATPARRREAAPSEERESDRVNYRLRYRRVENSDLDRADKAVLLERIKSAASGGGDQSERPVRNLRRLLAEA
ncbi:MAG: hypothetical protein K1X79_11015 [Oligoflexia bacterium]|nr:hypothetical protein [Oligoflexia bacterium]